MCALVSLFQSNIIAVRWLLINDLIANKDYFTTQKMVSKKQSLINWKWILIGIASLLSIEWFLRKYYGKIWCNHRIKRFKNWKIKH